MGLSQEVRFKITGDTKSLKSEFSSIPPAAKSAGERAGEAFERAFKAKTGRTIQEAKQITAMRKGIASSSNNSGGGGGPGGPSGGNDEKPNAASNVAKYAFRLIGGAIAYGLQRVIAYNQSRIEVAQAQDESTGSQLGSLRGTLASIGGLRGQLRQGQGAIKDIQSQREFEQKRATDLAGESKSQTMAQSHLNKLVSFFKPDELTKAEKAVQQLNAEEAKQHSANIVIERDLKLQENLYSAQIESATEIADLRARGLLTGQREAEILERQARNELVITEAHKRSPEEIRGAAKSVIEASGHTAQATRERSRALSSQLLAQDAQGAINSLISQGLATEENLAKIEEQRLQTLLEIERAFGTTGSVKAAELAAKRQQGSVEQAVRSQRMMEQSTKAESDSVDKTAAARQRGTLSELQSARIARDRAKTQAELEGKFGDINSQRTAALKLNEANANVAAAHQSARQHLLDVNQDLTGQAAEGRTFANGRARPLSETERLARRAQQFRERARRGILTGAGGDAGRFLDAAMGDEATVAGRLSEASAGVRPKDVADSSSIKPEIVRSNQLLEAIKNSLVNAPLD
jgi:hypothetical protein